MHSILLTLLLAPALFLSGCGSSGGTDNPPAPPAPVAPPPTQEPTFAERLQEWADMDPNPCRRRTPGFEALGGWLKDDGRDVGESRVWVSDSGALREEDGSWADTHGARVWQTFIDCAVRSDETQYNYFLVEERRSARNFVKLIREDGGDFILSQSIGSNKASEIPEPGVWWEREVDTGSYHNVDCGDGPGVGECHVLDRLHDGENGSAINGQRVLWVRPAGNDDGEMTAHVYHGGIQLALQEWRTSLVIITAGYSGTPENPDPTTGSSICEGAEALCLFARYDSPIGSGTSHSTPMVSAALDTVWAVWPEMDVLDLRNLAFDCSQNQDPRAGESSTERTFKYSNGRSFTSSTNPTWGHGVFSLTCLFTPNGGLQDPTTGNAISGSIYGPIAGPVTGASITGVDYTGRDFGYGFAHPVARENLALAATSNLRSVAAISGEGAYRYGFGSVNGRLWERGALRVDLTAAGAAHGGGGDAIGIAAHWQVGNLTIRSGIASQPEGAGSLTGSRAFRAPSTLSAAVTAAYAKALPHGFSLHVQADHWRTVATRGRSLWESAELSESRFGASLVKRAGRHEFAVQAAWQSGLAGSLDVDGRSWPVGGLTGPRRLADMAARRNSIGLASCTLGAIGMELRS